MRGWSRKIGGAELARPEFELTTTGVFDEDRYFDVFAEYAKGAENDVLIRITVENRGPDKATFICFLRSGFATPGRGGKSSRRTQPSHRLNCSATGWCARGMRDLANTSSPTKGMRHRFSPRTKQILLGFYGQPNGHPYAKDAFHAYVVHGQEEAVNPANTGTKFAAYYVSKSKRASRGAFVCVSRRKMKLLREAFAEFDNIFAAASARSGRILRCGSTGRNGRRSAAGRPAGLRGVALEQAILPLRDSRLARRRSRAAAPACRSVAKAATTSGSTFSTGISSPCPTNGNIPGLRHGISRFI